MALGHWLKDYIGPHSEGSGGSGGGGVLVVNGVFEAGHMTLDHTWQEIYDARAAVLVFEEPGTGVLYNSQLVTMGSSDSSYGCNFSSSGDARVMEFSTDSPNGYPENSVE